MIYKKCSAYVRLTQYILIVKISWKETRTIISINNIVMVKHIRGRSKTQLVYFIFHIQNYLSTKIIEKLKIKEA